MLLQWSKQPQNSVGDEPEPPPFDDRFRDDYVQKVWDGEITKTNLSEQYHDLAGGYLYKGAHMGFKGGPTDFTPGSLEEEIIRGIRSNIYKFSAAKQYQQVLTMSAVINDDQGLKTTFAEFKRLASAVFDQYNKNYLKAEFTTAVGQSQSARDWAYFQSNKAEFPYLVYHTQNDDRVRDEHKPLDGICRKVDDAFWRHYMPKNGWRCRCFVTAHEEGRQTPLKNIPKFGTEGFPELFNMNPGIDKLIFDPKRHPYFFVEKGDAGLKKDNFGLPIPE